MSGHQGMNVHPVTSVTGTSHYKLAVAKAASAGEGQVCICNQCP